MNSLPDPVGSVLQSLMETFQDEQINADSESLADMLWLAIHMPPEPKAKALKEDGENPEQSSSQQRVRVKEEPAEPLAKDQQQKVPLTVPPPRRPTESPSASGVGGTELATPSAPALRNKLLLGRSLRPLMQKVPSATQTQLNEVATAILMAEQPQSWVPILEPKPERWLSLSVVVDRSQLMGLWQETLQDFLQLLARQGAFQDVRSWLVDISDAGAVQLFSKLHVSPRLSKTSTSKGINGSRGTAFNCSGE